MKKAVIILIGAVFMLSCNQKMHKQLDSNKNMTELGTNAINKNNKNFDWLLGNWQRVDNDSENETFENWTKETNNRFLGHGYVMNGTDTIWQEKMILSKSDSNWALKVKTVENNDEVEFKLTTYNANAFTVENPTHDFPQKIKYWKHEEKLKALVSGGENEIGFEFEPIK